jgi:hypothetical protein
MLRNATNLAQVIDGPQKGDAPMRRNKSGVLFGKKRGEAWSYRREIPEDVRAALDAQRGRKLVEWTVGLGRISKADARVECAKLFDDAVAAVAQINTALIESVDLLAVARKARRAARLALKAISNHAFLDEQQAIMPVRRALEAIARSRPQFQLFQRDFAAAHLHSDFNRAATGMRWREGASDNPFIKYR